MPTDKREYMRTWLRLNATKVRAYREATKDRRNARRRELYAADPKLRADAVAAVRKQREKSPLARAESQYKVDRDHLELMKDRGCEVCGAGKWTDTVIHIDHNHRTGRSRGILCNSCNLALGHLRDDPIIIHALADYVMRAQP